MLHDLGAFWPVRPGSDGMYYHALYGPLAVAKLSPLLMQEIAVAVATPDWGTTAWSMAMGWQSEDIPNQIVARYRGNDQIEEMIEANVRSVTLDDGLDWLRVLLKRKPGYYGPVPVWTRRALRELRSRSGGAAKDLARQFGVKYPWKMGQWLADVR